MTKKIYDKNGLDLGVYSTYTGADNIFIGWVATLITPAFFAKGLAEDKLVFTGFAVLCLISVLLTIREGFEALRNKQIPKSITHLLAPALLLIAGTAWVWFKGPGHSVPFFS